MSEEELTTGEALTELHELLRLAALGNSPQRLAATSYTTCREILLQSDLRPALPGFLLQCLTIFRFKDFIHLYSPNESERMAFIDAAIRACETQASLRPTFDVFGDRDF
ncbi:MAG: hypothetical protein QOE79_2910 [Sphingomonadales bacterium]|nr:hypothetical protein [Sphingomonadales bacterium]